MFRNLREVGLTDAVFETGADWWEGRGDWKISSREFGQKISSGSSDWSEICVSGLD